MNPIKLAPLLLGLGVGYVLGTKAGREKYDALKTRVDSVWESPRVAKARRDVESYARQQAPIIRDRAEAVAKAAPGVIADTAKDVATNTTNFAKDVAGKTAEVAKDVAGKTADVAKDVADKTATTARSVADKTTATAKDVAGKTAATAKDVRDQVGKTASDLRGRGEEAVERATNAAGRARDEALDDTADDDDDDDAPLSGEASDAGFPKA